MRRTIFLLLVLGLGMTSCVSKKHLVEAQNELEMLKKKCNEQKDMLTTENDELKSKVTMLKEDVNEKTRLAKSEADKANRMADEVGLLEKDEHKLTR